MANPIVVEVTRGPLVESFHRGSIAVVDAGGTMVLEAGDVDAPVYPRSAVKALQAIALVESGAADAYGFTDEELSLACSSHNGEAAHVETARGMLEKAGLDEAFLECGPQPPRREPDLVALRSHGGMPTRLHNNCSGKHSGMLALAQHVGASPKGYGGRDHAVQRAVRAVMEEMAGTRLSEHECGIDGCSIPSWAMPLSAMAAAFARFGSGEGLAPGRSAACRRLREAVAAHPFMVAGTGRFCTELMEAVGPAAFVKTGAEGVFCAAFPERGLGLALKIDDGAMRASEVLMAAVVAKLCGLDDMAGATVGRLKNPRLKNWAGTEVGEIRVAGDIAVALGL